MSSATKARALRETAACLLPAAWRRARAISALGEPDGSLREGPITLLGRLRAVGHGCVDFVDGAVAVASCAATLDGTVRVDVRAPRVHLEIAGHRLELDGPIEIAAGSREALAPFGFGGRVIGRLRCLEIGSRSLRALRERAAVVRSLYDGDVVRVRGSLRRLAIGGGWALGPSPGVPYAVRCAVDAWRETIVGGVPLVTAPRISLG
ncbi:MAG: hypothetical protein NZ898_07690 [Myxococcota bacterium]|nr:hypothetical protein [Myxococcota bacterium]MDW8363018.1 hypothetical protein [Myxococcales bacterium]